jgi:4'-phosphopantetheinyl transferase
LSPGAPSHVDPAKQQERDAAVMRRIPPLSAGSLHLWRATLDIPDGTLAPLAACLSADERARADLFRFGDDRRRFAVSRAVLRHLLGCYLGRPAAAVRLLYGAHDKPYLSAEDGAFVHFNLAHSGALALVALTHRRAVGIDVERVRAELVTDRLAAAIMTRGEIARFRALPQDKREAAFFSIWTRKEAYLKAQGVGLSQDPGSIDITLSADLGASGVESWSAPPRLDGWHIRALALAAGYAGAVAVAGREELAGSGRPGRETGDGFEAAYATGLMPMLRGIAHLDVLPLAPAGAAALDFLPR